MDEKLIDQLYNRATSLGYKKSKDEFASLVKTDNDVFNDMFSFAKSNGLVSDETQFGSMVGRFQAPYKKKEESTTVGLPEQMFQTKPQAQPEPEIRVSPTPVGRGAKRMAGRPATESQLGDGLSGSADIDQRLLRGRRPDIVAEGTATPKVDVNLIREQEAYEKKISDETPKEVPYFTGTFGTILSAIDSPYSPIGNVGVGDFIDDMGRAISSGLNQGDVTTPANVLLLTGKNASPDQIKKYVAAVKDYEKIGASEEMMKFSKTYEDEGKTVYGFLKGLAENPGVIGELIVSSATAMLNPSSLAAASAVTGGFTAAGAAGAAPGAAAGALSSIPWAIGAAGTALETGLTFSELLNERLKEKGLEFTEENVKGILEDEKALSDIRNKSLARGATIGVIDGLTGRLAGKVGAKLVGNTAASRVKAGLAGAGIEMVGGSAGEAAGRVVAGQELDVAEIGLEGISEGPMAIADVTAEVLRRPIYKVNGERRSESDIESIISTASPEDLYKIDIDIKNDVKGYRKRIQDIIVDDQMRKEIRQANPNVNDETVNTILGLEKELKTFENNKTQSGKDRAAAIRSQIKTIQQDAIQEQAAGEVPVQPTTGVSPEVAQGEPQPKPEGVAEEGGQEISAPETEQEEVAKVQSLIGTPEGTPRFSVAEEGAPTEEVNQEDVEAIVAEMNKMSPDEINFTEPEVSQEGLQVDPVAESKSIIKPAVDAVKGLLKKIQDFNGIPMLQGMSDMLAAGRIKDSAGNDMDVEGGLLFNVVGKNKNAAWAGVSRQSAQDQYDNAVALYNSNKELFDRLWAEGKLPDGHIPMAIMRMADTAVNSNEATFRWALPAIEALPEENRKSAMDAFSASMQEKLNTKDAENAQKVLDFIKAKNITTLDQLFKEVVNDAKVRTKNPESSLLNLANRGYIYDAIFAPAGIKKASKPTVKALFSGVKNPNTSVFLSDTVYDSIGEPSMRRMKQGEVAGVVGIDVKNGGVVEVEHGNYGYGPKGQPIALISNPKHGIDVFPEYRAKASRVYKRAQKSTGELKEAPTPEEVARQTGGTFFTDAAFKGAKVMADAINDLNLLIGKLRFAFPSVSVSTTPQEFENIISQPDVRTRVSDGKVILGLTKDGKIYLNPEVVSLKTPIHEFGHIWIDFLRSEESGKKGTELLDRGLQLVVGTEEHKRAVQEYGDTELAKEEALVELMANKGATIIDAAQKSDFKSWMNATFKYIKQKFTTFKGVDRKKIADMSLDDFINTGIADLFSGEMVSTKFVPAAAETAARARMSAQGGPVESLSGYDKLMDDVTNTLIPNALKRKLTGEEMIKMVKKFVEKSDIYNVADDIQRDELVRQVNGMLGEAYRNPPSAQRLLGLIQDPVRITMTEKDLLKKQIQDAAKAAKNVKKVWMQTSQEMAKQIKQMVSAGKITLSQAAAVIRRMSLVNMLDENSVNGFVDYMAKVFKNAEYAQQIANVRKLLRNAKRNAETKIGVASELKPLLRQVFAINPSLIPDNVFEKYAKLVDMMGERAAVLTLDEATDARNTASDIMNAVNAELSLVDTLADVFENYQDKVLDDDGKVMYADTVNKMVDAGAITTSDAEILRKYKSVVMPAESATPMTDQEISDEKRQLEDFVMDSEIDETNLPSRDERDAARKLNALIKTAGVGSLTNTELKNLLKVIANINNGYFPHYAQVMMEKIDAANNRKDLTSFVETAKPLPLSKLYARIKKLVVKGKDTIALMVERNPIQYIEQVFGDFKTDTLKNALFNPIAKAFSNYENEYNKILNQIKDVENSIAKHFKQDGNKITMSKYKMMTYMLQLENDSNPGSKEVAPAMEFLKKTINEINSGETNFTERDAEMLQDIADKFDDGDGNIDMVKLYDSFSAAEKNAIKDLQSINASLSDKAAYTANVIRGQKFVPLNNYIHHSVIAKASPTEDATGASLVDQFNASRMPSTRAKSLIERTRGAKPINFDVLDAVSFAAKGQLMDYHLTSPIRTGRRAIYAAKQDARKMGNEKRDIMNAIGAAYERAIETVLVNSYVKSTFADEAMRFMSRQGYRAVLAGTSRFISELTSNVSFVMAKGRKYFIEGVKLRDIVMSADGSTIMRNLNSKMTNRVYSSDTQSGNLIDKSIMKQAVGVSGSRAKSDVGNKLNQIYSRTIKKAGNLIEATADTLISTPDKIVMRPAWFGAFSTKFEELTGSKPDFDMIASNDEAYMVDNQQALDEATNFADRETTFIGATDNPFMGILKGTVTKDQSAMAKVFNNFNGYMTRFLIYEYATARTAVNAMVGNGQLTKSEGASMLGAVATRMIVYSFLINAMGTGLMGMLLGEDDEEEETDKTLTQKLGQAVASGATGLVIGRDFGNVTKNLVNYGVEKINKKYLDFLRNGDYDPYKDAIAFSIIGNEKEGQKSDVTKMLLNMTGAFAPSLKTAYFVAERLARKEPKGEEAKERRKKELTIRLPLEILGNLGMVPLYKDVRKVVLKDIYKEMERANTDEKIKKDIKEMLLQGYPSVEAMRRYDKELYEQTFGDGGLEDVLLPAEAIKNEINKEMKRVKQEMMDDIFDYTPKKKGKKNSFSGEPFGGKPNKMKKFGE